ncbi:tRNA dimethylallyltransferase [Vallitalea longa]|uniref:tRNA dimethylallyltransferase n=1 Tax=Vallitalea longa TaxID=2936439 RepID=A0A9W5YAY2_9FIRM|nr:tRNA (adenosine(37)-N6)-dimethylallyltransferase MiaA [Vallitalea longa]GKX30132.1 tRNA dimethylallyltransferase [Vallitalea longa]
MKKPLIVIAGPTAVGKTDLSVKLAKNINGEIISADSMQVYKHMDIGTAKVTQEETSGIRHHLIDILDPNEEFNINIFQNLAKESINKIVDINRIPIMVGGTGFYIQSVLYDIDFDNTCKDDSYRNQLQEEALRLGNEHVHNMLKEIDSVSYNKIHPNNLKRVIRALEYYRETGKPISVHNERESQKESDYNLAFYVLNMDRKLLYERIDKRVDIMIEQGLVNEVEKLKDMGYTKDLVSMKGLGYKEIYGFLDGEYDLDRAIYILKRDTRHFAKRQITWFKREKNVRWINVDEYNFNKELILNKMLKDIEELGII